MSEKLYKVVTFKNGRGATTQKRIQMPDNAEGYWRRDVSKDGQTITFRRVA